MTAESFAEPLPRATLREEASRRLRSEIASGLLEPATIYPIAEIAARLGVSITPVREALLELSRDGLVEIFRNRGFRIREVTEADLDEIVELRLMLEVPAVRRLAGKLSPAEVSDLRRQAKEIDGAAARGDLVDYLLRDRNFHLGLIERTGNHRLVEIVSRLRDETRLYGLANLVGTDTLAHTAHEHVELVDALKDGTSAEVGRILTQHLRHTRAEWAAPR